MRDADLHWGVSLHGVVVVIRSLAGAEWSTYRAVRLAALRDAPAAFGGTYEHSAAHPEQTWRDWCDQPSWFAFVDGEPIGMVRVATGAAEPELISMWVAPQARGTGAAAELVGAVLTWARRHDHPTVRLHVIATNGRAHRLYTRMGFQDTGVREVLPDGRTELEMRWSAA